MGEDPRTAQYNSFKAFMGRHVSKGAHAMILTIRTGDEATVSLGRDLKLVPGTAGYLTFRDWLGDTERSIDVEKVVRVWICEGSEVTSILEDVYNAEYDFRSLAGLRGEKCWLNHRFADQPIADVG